MRGRLKECWRPRFGCSACCRCCRYGETGPAPTSPSRLGVTTRTVRNDIERLRILGYEVRSSTGTTGGYRLGAGSALPPLLLDDDEAVAVGVGLRPAAAGTVTGIEETSLRATDQARADPAGPAAAPARRPAAGHGLRGGRRPDRRRRDAHQHRRRLPRPRAAALRLPGARRRGQRAPRGAAPPGLHRSPLVPARLGPRPRRLAHLPRRSDPPAPARRPAVSRRASRPRTPRATSCAESARWPGSTRPGYACTRPPRSSPSASRRRPACCAQTTSTAASWRPAATPCVTSSASSPASTSAFEVLDPPELRTLLRELADRYAAAAGDPSPAAGD